eukprot:gene411-521_t
MSEGWCNIESDPGVFTELISKIGAKDIQVEEVYTLDPSEFARLKPVLGLIFLFKWVSEKDDRPISHENENIFFANQVINNACATQAILSILLNCKDIDLGDELSNFKSFTQDFPPLMKGEAIGNSDIIRETHNSFALPEPFIFKQKKSKKEEAFHFVSYLPIQGKLYELDGLKEGPICLSDCTDSNWLDVVTPFIQKRMDKYSQGEIRFNLMAVIKDRQSQLKLEIEELEKKKTMVVEKLSQIDTSVEQMQVDSGADLPNNKEQLELMLNDIIGNIDMKNNEILMEQEKFRNWKDENIRRRHNYVPFILNLIKGLAEKDQLLPLIQKAKDKEKNLSSANRQQQQSAK